MISKFYHKSRSQHKRGKQKSRALIRDSVPGHTAAAQALGVDVPGLFLRPSKVSEGWRVELRLLLPNDESLLVSSIILTALDDNDVEPGHFWPRRMERWLGSHRVGPGPHSAGGAR